MLSSFVGRTDDVRQVAKALGEHRLVTLVGPGGVGKTRLALEAAREVASTPMATACGGSISPPSEIPPPYRSRSPRFSAWTLAPGTPVLDRLASFVRLATTACSSWTTVNT